jgi:hypothetical protein
VKVRFTVKSALLKAVLCLTTSHIRESTKGFLLLTKYELQKRRKDVYLSTLSYIAIFMDSCLRAGMGWLWSMCMLSLKYTIPKCLCLMTASYPRKMHTKGSRNLMERREAKSMAGGRINVPLNAFFEVWIFVLRSS